MKAERTKEMSTDFENAALAGMKAWLKRNHRKARRTWFAAKRRIQGELKEGEVRK